VADVDAQGRPDLLNSERAELLAVRILTGYPVVTVRELTKILIDVEQHGLAIGRREVGVGSPYRGTE
jgi:hypothetical protein